MFLIPRMLHCSAYLLNYVCHFFDGDGAYAGIFVLDKAENCADRIGQHVRVAFICRQCVQTPHFDNGGDLDQRKLQIIVS